MNRKGKGRGVKGDKEKEKTSITGRKQGQLIDKFANNQLDAKNEVECMCTVDGLRESYI